MTVAAAALASAVASSPAAAQVFTVTNGNDSGLGSLRTAITEANATPGSTINFDYSGTITLLSALPALSSNAAFASALTPTTITGAGSPTFFVINPGVTLSVAAGAGQVTASTGVAANGTFDISPSSNTSIQTLSGTGIVALGNSNLFIKNGSTTFSGVITGGTGVLILEGTGTQTLTGANTYAGGTTLASGTLAVGNNSALGTGRLLMAAGTTLQFVANDLTIANQITMGFLDPTFDTGANTATLTGVISGTGALTKIGTGTLILTNTETYTGATQVNAGTLAVNGSIASSSSVTVANGGTLAGTGIVSKTIVQSGGTLAPGPLGGIGTLSVQGNLSIANGAFYQVAVTPAAAALTNVTGTATLSGGTVQVLAQNGIYSPSHTYTILTAAGGVTGTFSGATTNLALLRPSLSYDANDVFLTLAATNFCSVTTTRNQCSTASAIQALGSGTIYNLILNQTAAGARQAFDALSGEIHADTSGQILQDSRYFRDAVLQRLYQADTIDLPNGLSVAQGGSMVYFRYADEDSAPSSVLAYSSPSSRPQDAASPIRLAKSPLPGSDLTIWAQGLGAWGTVEGNGNGATLTRTLGGLFTGFDELFGPVRAGLAAGYLNSSLGLAARASSAEINSAHIGGYAGTSFGNWHVRGGAEYVWNGIATNRSVVFPGFADQTNANATANEAQVFGEVSYGLKYNGIAIEPFGSLAYVHVGANGFTEAGGAAALTGLSNASDIGYSDLGARVSTVILLPDHTTLTPWGSLAWEHAIGAVTPDVALAFAGTGTFFGIQGAPLARDAAIVQVGADLRFLPQATIGLNYTGQLARNANDQSVKGSFTWNF